MYLEQSSPLRKIICLYYRILSPSKVTDASQKGIVILFAPPASTPSQHPMAK
jgi:hypothetical protein